MPATAPPIASGDLDHLKRIGQALRDERKRQRISATAAAESAGISRVTLHRIERGEPSVAVGAWVAAAAAIGVRLDIARDAPDAVVKLPARVRLSSYPQLKKLAWQLHGVDDLSPREALSLYERNWRHVDIAALSAKERTLIEALSRALGGGSLLV